MGSSMTVVSLPKLKVLSTFLALILTFSLVSVEPINGSPKARKASTRSARKSAKGKSRSLSARARSRRGGSRSERLSSRYSRRGGRLYARGRGRRGRSRWRAQVSTSSHGGGVHNYLSQSWTQPVNPGEGAPRDAETGDQTPSLTAI